jgi:hypothetical protein
VAKELSRRELYELVWARPITKVTADLGISDVALHKICLKHRIPAPTRGYWAKVAAGKAVKPAIFRELSDELINRIRISGALGKLPPEVIEAHERARAATKIRHSVDVSDLGSELDLHSTVLKTKERLEKVKCGPDGFTHLTGKMVFSVSVSPTAIARSVLILSHLVRAALACGYRIEEGEGALGLTVDDEHIALNVEEKPRKIAHDLSEAESAKLARWRADCERKKLRGEWISEWDKPRIPEWDYVPSGLLTLEIDNGSQWDGLRRRFSDGKRQRLENLIGHIMTALATCAAARKAKREEQARRHREWQEQEKRNREIERRNTLESKRYQFLERQMKLFERARRIDLFVGEYVARHSEAELPSSCQEFICWARAYAEAVRDAAAPACLAPVLEKFDLMNDATEIDSWVTFE